MSIRGRKDWGLPWTVIFECFFCSRLGEGKVNWGDDLYSPLYDKYKLTKPIGWKSLDGKPWCGECDPRKE